MTLYDDGEGSGEPDWETIKALPFPELCNLAARVRTFGLDSSQRSKALKRWIGAGIALDRLEGYLRRLEALDAERAALNLELNAMRMSSASGEGDHVAWQRSYDLGVTIHLITVCVAHLDKLIDVITSVSGVKLAAEQRSLLRAYRDLRDVHEHLEQRLPGKSRDAEMTRILHENESFLHMLWSPPVRSDGGYVIGNQVIWVITKELERISASVRTFVFMVQSQVIEHLRSTWEHQDTVWKEIDLRNLGVVRRLGP